VFKLAYIRDTSPFIELLHAGAVRRHVICQVFLVVFLNILEIGPILQKQCCQHSDWL